ncbi:MAG: hypothetical protein R3F56_07225 [Planctomycetota bacterium]
MSSVFARAPERVASVWLGGVLGAISAAGALAQVPDDDGAAGADFDAVVARAAVLAEWAGQSGFVLEAGALVRRVQRVQPGHASAGLLRRFADHLADVDEELDERLRRQHAAEFARANAELRTELKRLLPPRAGDASAPDRAAILSALATLAPDMPGLAEPLRRCGLEMLGGYGAVPRADLEAARAELRRLGGDFLSALEAAHTRAAWSDAFGVRTRHYRVVANLDLPLVLEVARHLEAVYPVWEALANEAGLELHEPVAPLEVRLYDARATFDALIDDRTLRAACAREVDTVGVYSLRSRVACTFLGDDTAAARRALVENACHEAVHQLFHLRVRGRALVAAEDIPFSWVEESICLYCETIDAAAQVLGTRCDDDLSRGLDCASTDFDPLARVRRVCNGQFVDAGDYGCAALVASCLLEGGDREWRASFLAALRADMHGAAGGPALLPALGDGAKLRARLEAHAERVRQRCR